MGFHGEQQQPSIGLQRRCVVFADQDAVAARHAAQIERAQAMLRGAVHFQITETIEADGGLKIAMGWWE